MKPSVYVGSVQVLPGVSSDWLRLSLYCFCWPKKAVVCQHELVDSLDEYRMRLEKANQACIDSIELCYSSMGYPHEGSVCAVMNTRTVVQT